MPREGGASRPASTWSVRRFNRGRTAANCRANAANATANAAAAPAGGGLAREVSRMTMASTIPSQTKITATARARAKLTWRAYYGESWCLSVSSKTVWATRKAALASGTPQ